MSEKQILDSSLETVSSMIDEYYNPRHHQGKEQLTDLVEDEMRAQGLDPLNKNDVQKFWKSKGIVVNG